MFIAFCFEFIKYYNSLFSKDTFYITHFPIQLDATCNGYQHLSLLTGDEPLAMQLNLISGDKDSVPNDFYHFVALKLNDYLNEKKNNLKLSLKNKENIDLDIDLNNTINSCEKLLKLNINRKLVKLPIMIKPYNATKFQMVKYVKDQFELVKDDNNLLYSYIHKDNKDIKLNNNDFFLLIKTIEQIIFNEFPKLKEFNLYLKQIAEICSILNITIT